MSAIIERLKTWGLEGLGGIEWARVGEVRFLGEEEDEDGRSEVVAETPLDFCLQREPQIYVSISCRLLFELITSLYRLVPFIVNIFFENSTG